MIAEEKANELQQLIMSFIEKNKSLSIAIVLWDHDVTGNDVVIQGNGCMCCAREMLNIFIEDAGLVHNSETHEKETRH